MRLKMMVVRTLTAAVLFTMLAQVNVWVDTKTHLVLAVGYRALMLFIPAFMFLGVSAAMRASIALCVFSVAFGLLSLNVFTVALFALGMAVSGYLAKYVATHTSQGAADNKVSLNIGSLFSGLILFCTSNQTLTLLLSAGLLGLALYLAFNIDWSSYDSPVAKASNDKSSGNLSLSSLGFPLLGWLLVGVATGVKLTGIFTVLPQYFLFKLGTLPNWFGILVGVNSVLVILFQHRILDFLDGKSPAWTLGFSLSAMAFLSLPQVFCVEHIGMSVLWIFLLTLGECALSRYDRIAKEAGYLFPKELMVGVGSFLTVALSRNFPSQIYLSGFVGVSCLLLGWAFIHVPLLSHIRKEVSL